MGGSGLVRSKESIPAIRLVRVGLLGTLSTASCMPDQQLYARLFSNFAVSTYTSCGPELNLYQKVCSCARDGTMVLNGRIKTGNVAGDLRAIPVTSKRCSTAKVGISGGLEKLVEKNSWCLCVGRGRRWCHRSQVDLSHERTEARTRQCGHPSSCDAHPRFCPPSSSSSPS